MLRNAIFLGICIGTSASVPILYQSNPHFLDAFVETRDPAPEVQGAASEARPVAATVSPASGRMVEIASDGRGHFFGAFKINGRRIEALIDTGATAVAVNLSTARKLGVQVRSADMKHLVNTANGKARATMAILDRVEIGRISVDNVQALILEDEALSTTLIGMTFLNRLKRFQVDDGLMELVQ